ncbi:MAG: DUF4923 family protein [Bacteroidales bacterium]|nr:DUF4923 family protein [Candidatus Physcousia equi]
MKKIFTYVAALAAAFTISSCGLGGGTSTSNTANVLGAVAGGLLAGGNTTATSDPTSSLASSGLSLLSSLLGGNSVNTNSITGTWTYQKPQVTFESNSILANIGGQVAGNKLSSTLGTQLEKIGLKAGVSTFTFDGNGKVTVSVSGRQTTGTYTLSGNNLTLKGALGLASLNCTVSINGNQLYMLFDANAIFGAINKLGATSSTLSSLLSNYNGMKLGWCLIK